MLVSADIGNNIYIATRECLIPKLIESMEVMSKSVNTFQKVQDFKLFKMVAVEIDDKW